MKQNRNVVRINESKLKQIIAESVNNILNEFSIKYRDEEERLEKEYNEYLLNIEKKFGKPIQVLAATTNLHILNWKEFVKEHGSRELYYDLFGGSLTW